MPQGFIPVIETERLRLRGHQVDDLAPCAAMWADPEVVRYISGKPSTREEAWARILRNAGHWSLLGCGYWLVEEKRTGAFVGDVGLGEFKRELDPPIDGMREVGWVLSPAHQGKGYATEAANGAIGWARSNFGAMPMACIIAPANAASIRVAEKCGFTLRCQGTYKGEAILEFVLRVTS
jgi:RimJ/RimL family protein N-acetyltransferase